MFIIFQKKKKKKKKKKKSIHCLLVYRHEYKEIRNKTIFFTVTAELHALYDLLRCSVCIFYLNLMPFCWFFFTIFLFKQKVYVSHTKSCIFTHIDIYKMCVIMYSKIIYQSIFCIVSIHRENSWFSHSLKYHIVVNTQKNWHFYKLMMLCVS